MPESSVLTQRTQIAFETSPGTAVPANKRLLSVSIDPFAPATVHDAFRPNGYKVATLVSLVKEWSAASLSGRPDYGELGYLFAMILGTPTSAQELDGATPSGAYKHTFAPSSTVDDTIKTATIEQGNAAYTQRVAYALLNALSISFGGDTPEIGGDVLAARIEDAVTLTAAPTELASSPILRTHLDLYNDPTAAALGTTKEVRYLAGEWSMGDRFGTVWPLNTAVPSFAAHFEKEMSNDLKLTFVNNPASRAFIGTMRASGTRFFRLQATGPNIYTNAAYIRNHSLKIDLAAKISDAYSMGDEDGLATLEVPFTVVHDSVWGKYMAVELINKVASY